MLSSKCKAKSTSTFFLASRRASVRGTTRDPLYFRTGCDNEREPAIERQAITPVPTSQGPAALAGGCARPEQRPTLNDLARDRSWNPKQKKSPCSLTAPTSTPPPSRSVLISTTSACCVSFTHAAISCARFIIRQ